MAQAKRRAPKTQKKTPKKRTSPAMGAIGYQLSRLLTEVIFIFSMVISGILLAALLTYHETDPAWSHVSTSTETQNILGKFGAYLSDGLFFGLGWVAYLLPLVILIWGWVAGRHRNDGLFDVEAFLFRTLGGLVTIAGFAGLADLYMPQVSAFSPGGGVVGNLISMALIKSFGDYVAVLLLAAFVIAGVTLVTAMGWGQIFRLISGIFVTIFALFKSIFFDNKPIEDPRQSPTTQNIGYGDISGDHNDGHSEPDEPEPVKRKPPVRKAVQTSIDFSGSASEEAPTAAVEPTNKPSKRASLVVETSYDEQLANTESAAIEASSEPEQSPDAGRSGKAKRPLSPVAFAARFRGAAKQAKKSVPKPRIRVVEQSAADEAPPEETPTQSLEPGLSASAVPDTVTTSPLTSSAQSEPTPEESPPTSAPEAPREAPSGSHAEQPQKATIPTTSRVEVVAEEGEAIGRLPASADTLAQLQQRKAELSNGQLPSLDLLDIPPKADMNPELSADRLAEKSEQLENLLDNYGIKAEVKKVSAGPVITLYEIDPAPGVKVSQINNLAKDIARGMAVVGVRVLETIPGSTHIGIEVPNLKREIVYLREVFESRVFQESTNPLTLVLGKNISGKSEIANLAKMPHLLVAGTTGSGKSVAINAMLLSILFKATPYEVRLIMIDPKMLELSIYDDIPHLLTPVVTDMKEASNALRWCVMEMDRRYRLLSALKVRNIASYNDVVQEAIDAGKPIPSPLYKLDPTSQLNPEPPPLEPLPQIVVVIDELADLMMVVGKKVEELIARLAQKARAAGIHLILATQRPSVDVITGLIKANVPTRVAFQVSSKIDSRTILDAQGAENLLGNGDMLYMPPGTGLPMRAHGAFVDDDEVVRVVEFLKTTGKPDYIPGVTVNQEELEAAEAESNPESEQDELYDRAVEIVTTSRRAAISYLQRQLRIGFNRAARLVEDMQDAGVVSPPDSSGQREVIAPPPMED